MLRGRYFSSLCLLNTPGVRLRLRAGVSSKKDVVNHVHVHRHNHRPMNTGTGTLFCSERNLTRRSFSTKKIGASGNENQMLQGKGIMAWYVTKLETHPFTTKCITSGIISWLGNITCQCLEQRRETTTTTTTTTKKKDNTSQSSVDSSSKFIIEWDRAARFGILGFALIAPTVHIWYGFLGRLIPGISISKVLQRTSLDQFFFAPIFIPAFMTSLMILEEGPTVILHEAKRKELLYDVLKKDVPDVVVANWTVWIPAMLINFRYVPIKFQVLYSNSIGFLWNVYLSWKLNRTNDDDDTAKNNIADGVN